MAPRNRVGQHRKPGGFCILDQAAQQLAANAASLVSRQEMELVEKPEIRAAIDAASPSRRPADADALLPPPQPSLLASSTLLK
jgi:hypothetical protein